jgi:hypothetical protein
MGLWAADPKPAPLPDPTLRFQPGAYVSDNVRLFEVVARDGDQMWLEDIRSGDIVGATTTEVGEAPFFLVRKAPEA